MELNMSNKVKLLPEVRSALGTMTCDQEKKMKIYLEDVPTNKESIMKIVWENYYEALNREYRETERMSYSRQSCWRACGKHHIANSCIKALRLLDLDIPKELEKAAEYTIDMWSG